MKITKIDITDYGSFQGSHQFLANDRGLTLILGDNRDEPRMNSNGAGKSTIFEALDWCLFGVIPKDDHVDSVVNDAASACAVSVDLWDGDQTYGVQRKRGGKDSGVQLVVDGKDITALDAKETQKLINAHLGLDRQVFHATVLYGQNDLFHFAEAKDAERMEILTKILQLEPIDGWLEKAKDRAKSIVDDLDRRSLLLERAKGEHSSLEQQRQGFDAEKSNWENDRAETLRRAVVQVNEHLENIQKAEKVVAKEDTVRSMASVFNPMGTVFDWSRVDQGIQGARESERQCQEKLTTLKTRGLDLRARRDRISQLTSGDCSECGQRVTEKHVGNEISNLDKKLEDLRGEYTSTESSVQAATSHLRSQESDKADLQRQHLEVEKDLTQRSTEAQSQLAQIEETKTYLSKAQAFVDDLRKVMEETRLKKNPWEGRQAEMDHKILELANAVNSQRHEIQQLSETLKYYEFWKTAFGPKGLKSYILDSRLQEMTDAANEWVRMITGGTLWIRFETQTMGRSTKKLANKINIRVFRYNPNGTISERNYKSWSGGEKKRVSWAIDFGLSRLIAARATKQYDLMVLDEVFKHVDSAGGEAVVEMLQHLRQEKSSIFVIEHDTSMQSHFENRIVVRKENGCSRIVEDSDGDVTAQENGSGKKRKKKTKGRARRGRVPGRKAVREGGHPSS